jgi:hypothetical protein
MDRRVMMKTLCQVMDVQKIVSQYSMDFNVIIHSFTQDHFAIILDLSICLLCR